MKIFNPVCKFFQNNLNKPVCIWLINDFMDHSTVVTPIKVSNFIITFKLHWNEKVETEDSTPQKRFVFTINVPFWMIRKYGLIEE